MSVHVPSQTAEIQTAGNPALRVSEAVVEAQTGGSPASRISQTSLEAHTGGTPTIRQSFATLESQTGGRPVIRSAWLSAEVLMLLPLEPKAMSTLPLPIGGLPGLAWSVHLRPHFATRVATHVSGRDIRAAMMQYPVTEIELSFEMLRADAAHRTFDPAGFFLARQGAYDSFLLDLAAITGNPTDSIATSQQIGVGDGGTTGFTLVRATGGFTEPAGYVFASDLQGVFVNGSPADPATFTFSTPNLVIFHSAPANGAVIAASYRHYLSVRFAEDVADFEAFMQNLWQLPILALLTALPSVLRNALQNGGQFIPVDCFSFTLIDGSVARYCSGQMPLLLPQSGGAGLLFSAGDILLSGLRVKSSIGLSVAYLSSAPQFSRSTASGTNEQSFS